MIMIYIYTSKYEFLMKIFQSLRISLFCSSKVQNQQIIFCSLIGRDEPDKNPFMNFIVLSLIFMHSSCKFTTTWRSNHTVAFILPDHRQLTVTIVIVVPKGSEIGFSDRLQAQGSLKTQKSTYLIPKSSAWFVSSFWCDKYPASWCSINSLPTFGTLSFWMLSTTEKTPRDHDLLSQAWDFFLWAQTLRTRPHIGDLWLTFRTIDLSAGFVGVFWDPGPWRLEAFGLSIYKYTYILYIYIFIYLYWYIYI